MYLAPRHAAPARPANRAGVFCEGLDVHSEITRDDNSHHDHANEVENIHLILLSART